MRPDGNSAQAHWRPLRNFTCSGSFLPHYATVL